jgi:hypothetical protein
MHPRRSPIPGRTYYRFEVCVALRAWYVIKYSDLCPHFTKTKAVATMKRIRRETFSNKTRPWWLLAGHHALHFFLALIH